MKITVEEFYNNYWNEKSGEFELPENPTIIVKCPIEVVLRTIEEFRLDGFLQKSEIEVDEK